MRIEAVYSHKDGKEFIFKHHPKELMDLVDAINSVDALKCLEKLTLEKNKPPLLLSPKTINKILKKRLCNSGWTNAAPQSKKGFVEPRVYLKGKQFREMDGIKNNVGLEIQFGKYAFMGYDIFSKMPIFSRLGLIDCGIEVIAAPSIIKHMSTGVSSFSQIVTDMENRGVADIDIPTLVMGIGCTGEKLQKIKERQLNCDQN